MRSFLPCAIVLVIGAVILSFAGCSKTSEEELTGGNSVCDTTSIQYARDIVPILQSICYDCHGTGNTAGSGGILLQGYSNLKVYINSRPSGGPVSYLEGNVTHNSSSGYTPMPYGLPKLPNCEVNTIAAWIHQGAPNN
ncbi:MAG TPA: hypothetical protein VE035_04445 [Puia sp.]|nr:hypothetical protein [Puia sp.]